MNIGARALGPKVAPVGGGAGLGGRIGWRSSGRSAPVRCVAAAHRAACRHDQMLSAIVKIECVFRASTCSHTLCSLRHALRRRSRLQGRHMDLGVAGCSDALPHRDGGIDGVIKHTVSAGAAEDLRPASVQSERMACTHMLPFDAG